jgi:sugar lactone lactonase YvrE
MPTGICVDPRDSSILVADRCNARVMRFAAGGGQQGEEVIGAHQQLSRPWGICQGQDGAIFVSDERKALVLKLEALPALSSSNQQSSSSGTEIKAPVQQATAVASEDPSQLD